MTGVKTTHKNYDKYAPKWSRCRDVVAGQDAVHAAGAKYLPKLKEQEDADYKAYLTRAGFYNATWRTISGLLGMMFRKSPTMEVPSAIEEYLGDVTMSGTSFATLAKEIAGEILEVGRIGILVDHPASDTGTIGATKANASEMGLRPMMQTYHAETIINWKYRRVRNHYVLSMVVLKEMISSPKSEFKEEEKVQYRVLDLDDSDLYRVRLFQIEDDKDVQIGGDLYPLMNGEPLGFIPFYIVGTDGIDTDLDEPPLIDLVDVNLSHYRTNADYEHGCHFTGLPTAVVSGYTPPTENPEKFYIGSTSAWVFPDPNAKAEFLEFTGQGLGALEKNLDRKEQQMAILGARMLAAEKKQAETATTAAIHRTGENSILSSIALSTSEGLEKALGVFCDWSGNSFEAIYQLNRDYNPAMMDAQTLTALIAAVQAGKISDETLFDLLQRGDVIDPEIKFEQEQARIEASGPVKPDLELAA